MMLYSIKNIILSIRQMNSIAKNLLENKICENCFYHANPDKPLGLFCLKEIEAEYNTCNEWESMRFIDFLVFRGMKFITREDVEFAEKEIEKIKNKHIS